jgi:hypothetical protein
MGHAPWLQRLLATIKEDTSEGARHLPWLTPQLGTTVVPIEWSSNGNALKLLPNKNLSFCPGAIINGAPQPFVVGP